MATFGRASALALILLSPAAWAAPPTPEDVATARELYKEGADSLDMGDPKVAAQKLAQAWALVQTPVIGTDLARAQTALGHLVEAREAALAVQRLPVQHDETSRSTQARTDAVRIAQQLEPRIPHLKLVIKNVGEGYTPTVMLDGAAIPAGAVGVARQVNPGDHQATLDTDDGRHAEAAIGLREGESKELELSVAAEPLKKPEPKPEPDKQGPITQVFINNAPTQPSTSPLVWIGVATSAVGLATGIITGALALNEASIVKQHCSGVGTDGKNFCGADFSGDLAAANALATVSTIAFVAAGVGGGLVVTGLLLSRAKAPPQKTARVLPMLGPVSGIVVPF